MYLHFEEKDAVDAAAQARNVSPNAVIREAIRDHLGIAVPSGN